MYGITVCLVETNCDAFALKRNCVQCVCIDERCVRQCILWFASMK